MLWWLLQGLGPCLIIFISRAWKFKVIKVPDIALAVLLLILGPVSLFILFCVVVVLTVLWIEEHADVVVWKRKDPNKGDR